MLGRYNRIRVHDASLPLGGRYGHPAVRLDVTKVRPVGFEPTTFGFEVRDSRDRTVIQGNGLRQVIDLPAHYLPTDKCKIDPELAAVAEAWPALPEAVKASILILVKAAKS